MKYSIKILLGFIITSLLILSCEDDEKTAFDLHTQADNTAPYVRIILNSLTVDSSILDTAVISGNVSAPSNNVASWTTSVRLVGSTTTAFADVATITSFPNSISLTVTEIASSLGIALSDIQPADVFEFSGTSVGLDGRVLTIDDLAGDLSGQPEQRQAYNFSVTVFCAPVASNFVGDWTLDLVDTYGDGWDGAFMTATVDGVGTNYTATGSGTVHTVNIPAGTASLVWSYTSGAFEGEHNFTMVGPDGTTFGPFDGGVGIPFCFF